jgi:hypothetical protein
MATRQPKSPKEPGVRARGSAKKASSGKPTAAAAKLRTSVIMQARIDSEFARTLVDRDAAVLGLDGPSDLVRAGLRLVHQQAQEQAMANSYDEFCGEAAPLPAGVAPADK